MSGENVEAINWLYEQFAKGDFWAAREVLDPAIEWEWSASMLEVVGGRRTTYTGLDGVESALRDWLQAWDWFWVEAEEVFPAGDRVMASIRRHGRPKGSDVELVTTAFDVWTMRDGKAIRYRAYDEREEALAEAGLPAAGDLESRG